MDIGFLGLTKEEVFTECVEVLAAEPQFGTILVQENLPDDGTPARSLNHLLRLNQIAMNTDASISAFSFMKDSVTDFGRAFRSDLGNIGVMQGVNDAIAAVSQVRRFTSRPTENKETPGVSPSEEARREHLAVIESVRARATGTSSETEAKGILEFYGVHIPREILVEDEAAMLAAAGELLYPIVLKGVSARVAHKSDLGLVKLGLADEQAAVTAYRELVAAAEAADAELTGVLVTPMYSGGLEVLLAAKFDVECGHVVTIGRGGVETELYGEIVTGMASTMSTQRAIQLLERTTLWKLFNA